MRVMCIFSHPKRNSFNGAVLDRVLECLEKRGYEIDLWDLYALSFNPVLPLEEIQRGFSLEPLVQKAYKSVEKADAYVFIHPIWWGTMPAMLKGFLDRVFRSGVSFDFFRNKEGELLKETPLKGKKMLVCMSVDYPLGEISCHEKVWQEGLANFCALDLSFKVMWNLTNSHYQERRDFLDSLEPQLAEMFSK